MKRLWRIVLVGLAVLPCMAVPRMAAAQYYGTRPHIYGVRSMLNPYAEYVADGQTVTRNTHSGSWLEVSIWDPEGYPQAETRAWVDGASLRLTDSRYYSRWVQGFDGVMRTMYIYCSYRQFGSITISLTRTSSGFATSTFSQTLRIKSPW